MNRYYEVKELGARAREVLTGTLGYAEEKYGPLVAAGAVGTPAGT